MSEDRRFLLVLVEAERGAWRRVHGSVEISGGKVLRIDVDDEERPVWIDVLKAARVSLEANNPDATQRVPTTEGERPD